MDPISFYQLPNFLFVAVLAQPFFALVGGHFMALAFTSTRH